MIDLKNSKILIVDDIIKNIELLANALSKEGYSIGYSLNGNSTLSTLKSTKYDLVLLDVMMPDLNGFEVCKIIRNSISTTVPIIFVTAKNDQDSVIKGFESGGNDYISKPLNIQELLSRVKTNLIIKKQAEQLKEYNLHLEEKVQEKTETLNNTLNELKVINRKLKNLDIAKTNFLTLISHELNTPLSVIYGFTEILYQHISDKNHLTMLNSILQSAEKLIRISKMSILITSIVSKKYKTNFLKISLLKLFETALQKEKKFMDSKNITVEKSISEFPDLLLDSELIINILSNLLNNSIKYAPENSSIKVDFFYKNNYVNLIIKDSGEGFKKEQLSNINNLFQVDGDINHHKSGIGLSLIAAKYVLDLHNGIFSIYNDDGACVKLEIPYMI